MTKLLIMRSMEVCYLNPSKTIVFFFRVNISKDTTTRQNQNINSAFHSACCKMYIHFHYMQLTGNADWDMNINDLLYNYLHDHHTALYSSL
jgi:hypothetical protein